MPEKLTTSIFRDRVNNLTNGEYSLLSDYINTHTKVLIKHNTCGREYFVTPNHFSDGKRCPYCAREAGNKRIKQHCGIKEAQKARKTTKEKFIENLKKYKKDKDFTILSEFKGYDEPITIKHNICGTVFKRTPHQLFFSDSCPECSKRDKIDRLKKYSEKRIAATKEKLSKTENEFRQDILRLTGEEYTLSGKFISNRTLVEITHNVCKKTFLMKPTNFIGGNRCPYCRESRSECFIREFLIEKNIIFETQKIFEDCRNIDPLKFDFFIRDKILIEYDGEFHYKNIRGGENNLREQQIRDKIKNKYCKENKIPLLRIPFWEKDRLEEILSALLILLQNEKLSYTKFEKWRRSLKIKSYKQYKIERKKNNPV